MMSTMDNENVRNIGKSTNTRREQGSGVTRVGSGTELTEEKEMKKGQGR